MLEGRRLSGAVTSRVLGSLAVSAGLLLTAGAGVAGADHANVLIYSGTTAHRHVPAINQGIVPIQNALDDAHITYDWENCGETADVPNCTQADQNARIFTDANLAQYDAIYLFNSIGPNLWNQSQRDAIRGFVNDGGGIAANHAATDMGAGQETWGWWDGAGNSALGTTMPGHPAAPQTATVHVSDRNHPSTKNLPDTIEEHSDEHYSFNRSVRGTHHVLATLDETSYDPLLEPHAGGGPPVEMGADHPISWCRPYDGGRIWATSMGHFPEVYTQNGGDNYLIKHLVGGIQWAAGIEGTEGDCGGTVWGNFRRTVLSTGAQGPMGLDISNDGRVYWTEIGPDGHSSFGRLKVWDPETGNTTLVAQIETRADALSASEDGVLGMALDPDFDSNNQIYIYYSPRAEDEGWPGAGSGIALGYNRLSRFTLDEAGTAIASEQPILHVPKVKVGQQGDGIAGQPRPNWPAHTGGAGLDFDSEGNLYLGVGDDINPYAQGTLDGYVPIDQRYEHRYDARNTSANTNDLRGKVLRITPVDEIAPGTQPGPGETYGIPEGNMFEPGTPDTKPEIYAMGFRQPFTIQADPNNPGTVVVGEYGPDAAQNNATRGPAGIIEWNHITEPGFFGWPFCTGDNSVANTYFEFEFPSGLSGDQFDCSAAAIPNESSFNTGLDDLPGPAVPADVWHKRNGEYPKVEFGDIPEATYQEPNTGPIYDYDPDNPSTTKWPAYFDGSWLILDRGQNWWREARLTDDGQELLKVNGFFQPNQFGPPNNNFPIPIKFGPDGALYMGLWTGGCCRNLQGGNGQIVRIDYVGDQLDQDAPTVDAQVSGPQTSGGDFAGQATLEFTAGDGQAGSGVERIEYSLDGSEWTEIPNDDFAEPFTATVPFEDPDDYDVLFRAFDREDNESDEGQTSFTVIDGSTCVFERSDEFDGSGLDTDMWTERVEDGHAASVSDGALVLPVLDEIDGTLTGPLSFVSQQVPAGDDWSVTTRVTIEYETNWQQAGLMLWQSDGNFVKVGFTGDAADGDPAQRRFEITADDPEDTRHFDTDVNVGAAFPTTAWIRMFREDDAIRGAFAPDEGGEPGSWTTLPGARLVSGNDNGNQIDPPREGEGVMVGPYAGGQNGGPWTNTAAFDFVRFVPDEVECAAGEAPTTSIELNGAAPVPTYDADVDATLSATPGGSGSPVDYTEYSVDGGEWIQSDNDGDDPFVTEFMVSGDGEHSVEYRSVDDAGNEEAPKTVEFTITDGGGPGPRDIFASDQPTSAVWLPDQVDAELGEEVTWHFDGPEQGGTSTTSHNVYLVAPGDDPATDAFAISPMLVAPGGDPASHTFDQAGTWSFYCSLHAAWTGSDWSGTMYGTIDVGEGATDTTPPVTTVMLNDAAPQASYDGDVTATLTATDPGPDASGVDFTEYRIDSDDAGDWQTYNQLAPPVVTGPGEHEVDYRSTDVAGNAEEAKAIEFTITGDDPGSPELRANVKPKRKVVGRRAKQASFKFNVRNVGDAATGPLTLCAKAPKRRLKVKGRKCRTTKTLAADAKVSPKFRFKIKRAARGKKTRIQFVARGKGVANKRAAAVLKVRSS